MPRESLQVTTAHLRELAARHRQAAAEITSATDAVTEVDSGIRRTHGVVASSTARAVETIQQARRDAGYCAAGQSQVLSGSLAAAARRYEATDLESGGRLGDQIRPGPASSTERLG